MNLEKYTQPTFGHNAINARYETTFMCLQKICTLITLRDNFRPKTGLSRKQKKTN